MIFIKYWKTFFYCKRLLKFLFTSLFRINFVVNLQNNYCLINKEPFKLKCIQVDIKAATREQQDHLLPAPTERSAQ